VLKYGSRAGSVRRLQRALNAAEGSRIEVTGYFDRKTQREVKSYQRGRALARTGVMTVETWDALQQGRR
jgi:peptidoglycan hydrolase-like protein with peptidoglycan-binding domain